MSKLTHHIEKIKRKNEKQDKEYGGARLEKHVQARLAEAAKDNEVTASQIVEALLDLFDT